jgi:hypothetical protein
MTLWCSRRVWSISRGDSSSLQRQRLSRVVVVGGGWGERGGGWGQGAHQNPRQQHWTTGHHLHSYCNLLERDCKQTDGDGPAGLPAPLLGPSQGPFKATTQAGFRNAPHHTAAHTPLGLPLPQPRPSSLPTPQPTRVHRGQGPRWRWGCGPGGRVVSTKGLTRRPTQFSTCTYLGS